MTTIFIGEKKRPFKFGINAMRTFCKATGKKINDLDSLEMDDFDSIIEIMFAGLEQGARMAQQDVDFDSYIVGLWLDDVEADVIPKAFASMTDQLAVKKKAKKVTK